jgi:hypothetical protein
MMIETSAYYGQPTAVPLPFSPQAGYGTAAQYGLPNWQLLGGPLAHQQLWGQFGPPLYQHPQPGGQFGAPLQQYGQLAGPAISGWLGQPTLGFPPGGWGGQLARSPLLEAFPAVPLTTAFAPHGFVGNQIGRPLGAFPASFGQRGLGISGFPFQAAPALAHVG